MKPILRPFVLLAMGTLASSLASASVESNAIYGDDNRTEWSDVRQLMHLKAGEATGAIFLARNLVLQSDDTYLLPQKSMADEYGVCSDERFSDQPVGAECSGVLIGADLFLTAKHCIKNQRECSKNKIVFGYQMSSDRESHKLIPSENVFGCVEIVSQNSALDFSILRLDRSASNLTPIELREDDSLPFTSEEIFMTGHPLGLPRKLTDGAEVWKVKRNHFVSNLDAFGGNSGSPIFSASDGRLLGILIEGENDFKSKRCQRPRICGGSECEGETAVLATSIARKVRER